MDHKIHFIYLLLLFWGYNICKAELEGFSKNPSKHLNSSLEKMNLKLPYIFSFLLEVCPPPIFTIIAFGQLSAGVTICSIRFLWGKKGFEINVCSGALHSEANEMVRQSVGH